MPREEKKRRRKDSDSSDDERGKRRRSKTPSPSPAKERRQAKSRSPSPAGNEGGGGGDFSLSIEETNKLRAQLGMAPLETDDTPKIRDAEDGNLTDKIINEEGFEFRHRKAKNWGDKKKDEGIKEKIEVAKKKREIYAKVLKSKGLADDSSDDEASGWVSKQRQLDEERKKAEERAKMLDQMDEEFGVSSVIEEKKKQAKKKDIKRSSQKDKSLTGGLIVGHSKAEFLSGEDQVLVLEDKGVLDEGDEVLVNPNIVDKERTNRNVELKKRKGKEMLEDQFDEWGNPKDRGLLAKYDDELEGEPRERFRLDESGQVDIEREREEAEMRKRLMMAGKTLVDLDDSNKFSRASEYYTQEEMISFRKVKKEKKDKKLRKRGKEKGILKADDLEPIEQGESSDLGTRGRRRRQNDEEAMDTTSKPRKAEPQAEDGEIEDETPEVDGKWRRTQQQAVDLDALKRVVEREMEEEESDDDLIVGVDLSNVVLDYDAENELQSVLEKARRLKQQPTKSNDIKMEIKEEPMEENAEDLAADPDVVMIDSTMEYCRNIGEIRTHGFAGNREDAIDFESEEPVEVKPPKVEDEEKTREKIRRFKEEKKRRQQAEKEMRGGWTEASLNPEDQQAEAGLDDEDEEILKEMKEFKRSGSDSEEDDEGEEEDDVLGGEIDATKGIGAMLKLAAKKGYLEDANKKRIAGENLDHLKSKNFSKVESASYDIEEKYTKKLEKMGTTGRGPTQEFCEKKHYKPDVDLSYVDNRGRELDPKDAFRIMSWKFHGKMPGKKQQEKRARQIDQKELLKTYVSSSDTPLGTLSRQRKKQEQLQTPYLVLSGNTSHQNFKKD